MSEIENHKRGQQKRPVLQEDGPGSVRCLEALVAIHLNMHKMPPTRRAVTVMRMMVVLAVRRHVGLRVAGQSGRVKRNRTGGDWRGRSL